MIGRSFVGFAGFAYVLYGLRMRFVEEGDVRAWRRGD